MNMEVILFWYNSLVWNPKIKNAIKLKQCFESINKNKNLESLHAFYSNKFPFSFFFSFSTLRIKVYDFDAILFQVGHLIVCWCFRGL